MTASQFFQMQLAPVHQRVHVQHVGVHVLDEVPVPFLDVPDAHRKVGQDLALDADRELIDIRVLQLMVPVSGRVAAGNVKIERGVGPGPVGIQHVQRHNEVVRIEVGEPLGEVGRVIAGEAGLDQGLPVSREVEDPAQSRGQRRPFQGRQALGHAAIVGVAVKALFALAPVLRGDDAALVLEPQTQIQRQTVIERPGVVDEGGGVHRVLVLVEVCVIGPVPRLSAPGVDEGHAVPRIGLPMQAPVAPGVHELPAELQLVGPGQPVDEPGRVDVDLEPVPLVEVVVAVASRDVPGRHLVEVRERGLGQHVEVGLDVADPQVRE